MSINQSPSTVTSGLVFSMDANNRKSYVGPPIKNNPTGISFAGVSTGTGYVCTSLVELIDIPQLGITTVYTSNIQNNYSTSGNCCPSLFQYGGYAVTGSTLYTYGIVYRSQSGYTHPNFMYRYEYNGGSYVTESGVFDNSKRIHLGNGWYWAWNTFTTQPSTTLINSSGLWYYNYSAFSDKISVAKIFVTQGDYTGLHPKYWPENNVTRSNTQALVDLTGQNTITATSLSYANDGTFSFNGSQYLSIPDNASIRPSSGYITTEVWFKATATGSQNGSILINKENEYEISAGGGYITYAFRPNWAWVGATAFNTNQNYCVTITYDQVNQKMYLNGVEVYSAALTGAIGNAYSDTLKIGARGGTGSTYDYFTGNIYNVKIYNRGLSASEVAQNFAAQRGRYGI
jgi:hypothetical protein